MLQSHMSHQNSNNDVGCHDALPGLFECSSGEPNVRAERVRPTSARSQAE